MRIRGSWWGVLNFTEKNLLDNTLFKQLKLMLPFLRLEFFWTLWRECSTPYVLGLNHSSDHGVLACQMPEIQHLVSDSAKWQWCWEQSSETTCRLLWRNSSRMLVAFQKLLFRNTHFSTKCCQIALIRIFWLCFRRSYRMLPS